MLKKLLVIKKKFCLVFFQNSNDKYPDIKYEKNEAQAAPLIPELLIKIKFRITLKIAPIAVLYIVIF